MRLEHTFGLGLSDLYKFQFHKGAIRTSGRYVKRPVVRRFQFHKGAIRTKHNYLFLIIIVIFQFHKGAIRTRKLTPRQYIECYFNSIKVRLELS